MALSDEEDTLPDSWAGLLGILGTGGAAPSAATWEGLTLDTLPPSRLATRQIASLLSSYGALRCAGVGMGTLLLSRQAVGLRLPRFGCGELWGARGAGLCFQNVELEAWLWGLARLSSRRGL